MSRLEVPIVATVIGEGGSGGALALGVADRANMMENAVYSDPNPYNPAGNLRLADGGRPVSFDLTRQGPLPRVERTADGRAVVRASSN